MRHKMIIGLLIAFFAQNASAQLGQDKVYHFLGGNLFGLAGAGLASELSDGNRGWTFAGSVGGSLLIGLAKEAIDERQYGGWDNDDLLATVLGGVAVGVTIDLFKQKKKRKRDRIYEQAVGRGQKKGISHKTIENLPENAYPITVLGLSHKVRSALMD